MLVNIKNDNEKVTGEVLNFLKEKGISYTIDTPKGHFIRSEIDFSIESGDIPKDSNIEEIVDFIGEDYNFCDGLVDKYKQALKEYIKVNEIL